jgi:hypothetical protein
VTARTPGFLAEEIAHLLRYSHQVTYIRAIPTNNFPTARHSSTNASFQMGTSSEDNVKSPTAHDLPAL